MHQKDVGGKRGEKKRRNKKDYLHEVCTCLPLISGPTCTATKQHWKKKVMKRNWRGKRHEREEKKKTKENKKKRTSGGLRTHVKEDDGGLSFIHLYLFFSSFLCVCVVIICEKEERGTFRRD